MSTRLIDLTGQRFGKLIVIERGPNNSGGQSQWLCRCECRNTSLYAGPQLRRGAAQQCRACGHPGAKAARPGRPLPLEQLSYTAVHKRVAKLLPAVCARCGATEGRLDVAFRHDTPAEFRRVSKHGLTFSSRPEDFVRLCRATCHRNYDRGRLRVVPRLVQTALELAA